MQLLKYYDLYNLEPYPYFSFKAVIRLYLLLVYKIDSLTYIANYFIIKEKLKKDRKTNGQRNIGITILIILE